MKRSVYIIALLIIYLSSFLLLAVACLQGFSLFGRKWILVETTLLMSVIAYKFCRKKELLIISLGIVMFNLIAYLLACSKWEPAMPYGIIVFFFHVKPSYPIGIIVSSINLLVIFILLKLILFKEPEFNSRSKLC
jgi:hypothetical protein